MSLLLLKVCFSPDLLFFLSGIYDQEIVISSKEYLKKNYSISVEHPPPKSLKKDFKIKLIVYYYKCLFFCNFTSSRTKGVFFSFCACACRFVVS